MFRFFDRKWKIQSIFHFPFSIFHLFNAVGVFGLEVPSIYAHFVNIILCFPAEFGIGFCCVCIEIFIYSLIPQKRSKSSLLFSIYNLSIFKFTYKGKEHFEFSIIFQHFSSSASSIVFSFVTILKQ